MPKPFSLGHKINAVDALEILPSKLVHRIWVADSVEPFNQRDNIAVIPRYPTVTNACQVMHDNWPLSRHNAGLLGDKAEIGPALCWPELFRESVHAASRSCARQYAWIRAWHPVQTHKTSSAAV